MTRLTCCVFLDPSCQIRNSGEVGDELTHTSGLGHVVERDGFDGL
jgi:hypothetical protein